MVYKKQYLNGIEQAVSQWYTTSSVSMVYNKQCLNGIQNKQCLNFTIGV